jgi:dTDP-4-dehydrorhamnose 3,5-epimerase
MIHGVLLTEETRVGNPKGDVLHVLKKSSPGYSAFGEAYFTTIYEGVAKGWKRHRRVTLNLVVSSGLVLFVIHDDRPKSPTFGQFDTITLGQTRYARLTVPPGLWLAFQGKGPGQSLILDIVDEEHDPAEAESLPLAAFPFDFG